MKDYKPQTPFDVPLKLYIPTYETISGIAKKNYPTDGILFFGSFKTYGGTETTINGVYSILDTANIETWYRPDIKSDCRIERANDGAMYEILGEPENINMRNQYLKFRIRRVKGGA